MGLLKKTFFLRSDAANGFSRCITRKNDIDQFSQKNFKGELRPSEAIYQKIHHKILRLSQKKRTRYVL